MITKLPFFSNIGLSTIKNKTCNNTLYIPEVNFALFGREEPHQILGMLTQFSVGDALSITDEGIFIYGVLTFRNPNYNV